MWHDCFAWGGIPFFPLLIILILSFLVYSIFNTKKRNQGTPDENRALENLKMRYAKGEIDKDEYEKIKQDLL